MEESKLETNVYFEADDDPSISGTQVMKESKMDRQHSASPNLKYTIAADDDEEQSESGADIDV